MLTFFVIRKEGLYGKKNKPQSNSTRECMYSTIRFVDTSIKNYEVRIVIFI